ncbi:hypothetical protein V498_10049, partial [Pseudogymnoascus sp. VKM F-4517 (FW-2822)]
MSMVTATAWVPRGFAAPFPTKYEFDEAEFDRIAKLAKLQLDDAQEDLEEAEEAAKAGGGEGESDSDSDIEDVTGGAKVKSKGDEDDDLAEYDLEHYDSDVAKDTEGEGMGMFGNVKS